MSIHHLTKEPPAQPTARSEAKSDPAKDAPPLPFWASIWRNARHFLSVHIVPMFREAGTYRSIVAGLVVAATALVVTPLAVVGLILGGPAIIQLGLAMVLLIVIVAIVEAGLTAANRIVKGRQP